MKSILVLEEDAEGREILAKMLRIRGFRVFQAENEAAAVAVLGSGRTVDLVLAVATGRDRTDFLAGLRTRPLSMPVVFLADTDCRDPASGGRLSTGGFMKSRSLNFYMNARRIDFSELDRLIRIALIPRQYARFSGIRAA